MARPDDVVSGAERLLGATGRPLGDPRHGRAFLVELGGERVVVRVYERDAARAAVDDALLRLLRGLLPVPEVLDARLVASSAGPAHLVLGYLPGVPLSELLRAGDVDRCHAAGRSVARVLARLSGMPFLRPGELRGADLAVSAGPVSDPADLAPAALRVPALAGWTAAERAELRRLARSAQARLDRVRRSCLVHAGDLLHDLLVDPASGEVTGVVGWSHARAGRPYADLGTLFRLATDDAFRDGLATGYERAAPDLDGDYRALAAAADLSALLAEASAEPTSDPDVAATLAQLRRLVRRGGS